MHNGVEFHVDLPNGDTRVFDDGNQAAGLALSLALMGKEARIDVVVLSEKGADHFGGIDAVLRYREDPDASVFERIVVRAHSLGRVP